MILTQSTKLDQVLIRLLSKRSRLSAEKLRSLAISRTGKRPSTAAVYKELGKLQSMGIVVKDGGNYSLGLDWVLEMQKYAELLHSTYFTRSYLETILPPPGKRQVWRFTRLLRANDLWNQAILALLGASKGRDVYAWVPHPWFVLIHPRKETALHRALSVSGRRFHTIFGGSGYLDRLAERLYSHESHELSFAQGPFAERTRDYIDLIDDYVLTISVDAATARAIEDLFSSVRKQSDLDPALSLRLLTMTCSVRMTLERSETKANSLRKKFVEFFG